MLSEEQQKTIENSIWVVNTALKKQGLQADEDLRQDAILFMCKCLQKFDPSKNIKWTTYAYRNVFLYIKRIHHKQVKKNSMLVCDDLVFPQKTITKPIELNESSFLLDEIKEKCTPKEREIIELKLLGYRSMEIGAIMGYSQSSINAYMQLIKEKAKEIKDEYICR